MMDVRAIILPLVFQMPLKAIASSGQFGILSSGQFGILRATFYWERGRPRPQRGRRAIPDVGHQQVSFITFDLTLSIALFAKRSLRARARPRSPCARLGRVVNGRETKHCYMASHLASSTIRLSLDYFQCTQRSSYSALHFESIGRNNPASRIPRFAAESYLLYAP